MSKKSNNPDSAIVQLDDQGRLHVTIPKNAKALSHFFSPYMDETAEKFTGFLNVLMDHYRQSSEYKSMDPLQRQWTYDFQYKALLNLINDLKP